MSETLIEAKNRLRTGLRAQLRVLDENTLKQASGRLVRQLQAPGVLGEPNATVALFGGIPGEPDLLPLIDSIQAGGGRVVFFGFDRGMLVPCVVRSAEQLERGVFGVWVPKAECPVIPASELDVILVPGLGFDSKGRRLGRGRGHFDRLFALPEVKARRIGVCLDLQVVDEVPVEAHDAPMDAVISESGVVR